MTKGTGYVILPLRIIVLKGFQIFRCIIIIAVFCLCSCKGQAPLFLGQSVGNPLPTPGTVKSITELLPATVEVVCNFGPYTDQLPDSVPEIYRKSISESGIFPVSEIEGYFVYLAHDGSVVASDVIGYSTNGYRWGFDSQRGDFVCEAAAEIFVTVRFRNDANYLYLTRK